MARSTFGGTNQDGVFTRIRFGSNLLLALATATLTFWDAETGGTQYTDLLDEDGQPVTEIETELGQVPVFQGPDGVTEMWADDGDKQRARMLATDVITIGDAKDEAIAASDAAAAAVASIGRETPNGVAGLDAAGKLTSLTRIPDLPASKVTSGELALARIPDLPASKITSPPWLTSGEVFTRVPPWSEVVGPYFSAHRGGGKFIAPENTLVSKRMSVARGLVVDAADVRTTLDGVPIDMHDSTLDRTTTLSGTVASKSLMGIIGPGVVDCSSWFGGGWTNQAIPTLDEILATIGGQTLISVEAKDAAAGQAIATLVARRGLQEHVLVASFTEAWLYPARDIGCPVMLLKSDGTIDGGPLSRGIAYAGVDGQTVAQAQVTALVGLGYKVSAFGLERHTHIERLTGLGLFGYISEDPIYTRGRVTGTYDYRLTADPFASATYYHGHQPENGDPAPTSRGIFESGGWWGTATGQSVFRAILQGWACPLPSPSTYTIEFDHKVRGVGGTQRWGGIAFGCPTDKPYEKATGVFGYEAFLRGSGVMNVWRRDGVLPATSIGSLTTTAIANDTLIRMRLVVTPTTVALSRLDTGQTLTVTDNTYRGAYWHLVWDLDTLNQQALFKAVTVA